MEQPLLLPSVAWSSCLLCDPDELVWTMSKRCHVPTFLQDPVQAALGSPASWHVSSRLYCSFSNPQEGKARQLLFHFPVLFASYFISWLRPKPPRHSLSPQRRIIHLVLHIKVYTSSLGFLVTLVPSSIPHRHPSPPLTHTPQHTLIKKH